MMRKNKTVSVIWLMIPTVLFCRHGAENQTIHLWVSKQLKTTSNMGVI